jgi:hypothetical protein
MIAAASQSNFARVDQTLRCTPEMAAGISDHIWCLELSVNWD